MNRPRASVDELVAVMAQLRSQCPWDARQTHRSLVPHLVEETCEVIDAVEAGSDADLVEELGDLLLQVVFHARIGAEEGRFDIDEVAGGIVAKLRHRHPHVFAGEAVPDDMDAAWEQRKAADKGRRSPVEGIADSLPSLARAAKVVYRCRAHGVELDLPDEPISAEETGRQILALVARAQASGVDADQATRDAVRALEDRVTPGGEEL